MMFALMGRLKMEVLIGVLHVRLHQIAKPVNQMILQNV